MGTQLNFVLKVLILSAGISIAIKYGGSSLAVASTSVIVPIALVTPSLILAIALLARALKYRQPS